MREPGFRPPLGLDPSADADRSALLADLRAMRNFCHARHLRDVDGDSVLERVEHLLHLVVERERTGPVRPGMDALPAATREQESRPSRLSADPERQCAHASHFVRGGPEHVHCPLCGESWKHSGTRGADAPPERDRCQLCNGWRGGVPGNENMVRGVIVCDYCSATVHRFMLLSGLTPAAQSGIEDSATALTEDSPEPEDRNGTRGIE